MKNNKGITLAELIVSFALVSIVCVYFFQTIITINKMYNTVNEDTNDYLHRLYLLRLADAYKNKPDSAGNINIDDLKKLDLPVEYKELEYDFSDKEFKYGSIEIMYGLNERAAIASSESGNVSSTTTTSSTTTSTTTTTTTTTSSTTTSTTTSSINNSENVSWGDAEDSIVYSIAVTYGLQTDTSSAHCKNISEVSTNLKNRISSSAILSQYNDAAVCSLMTFVGNKGKIVTKDGKNYGYCYYGASCSGFLVKNCSCNSKP